VRFDPDAGASVVMRRRVEELVRGLEELEEDEGEGGRRQLRPLRAGEPSRGTGADELLVYGTTSLVANHAIIAQAVEREEKRG
jgi:hypothetical protein